jgi:CRP-like cAMP-binding protein
MQSLIDRILLLKNALFFEYLRTDELKRVAVLLEPTGWVRGERVFDIGDPVDAMYFIVSGSIGISRDPNPARANLVAKLGPGECFGDMDVIDELPRASTAHVLEDAEAFSLDKERFHALLMAYPELGLGMLRALARRLRHANEAAGQQRGTR